MQEKNENIKRIFVLYYGFALGIFKKKTIFIMEKQQGCFAFVGLTNQDLEERIVMNKYNSLWEYIQKTEVRHIK